MASADVRDLMYGGVYTGTADVQSITINGGPTGGTFTLSFGGQTTAGIAFNAAASAVQTALRGLSSIGGSNVNVTGSAGGPYTVTFAGTMATGSQALITADGSSLAGGTSPSVTVAHQTVGSPSQQAARGGSQTVWDMYSNAIVRINTDPNDMHYAPNGDLYHE